MLWFLLHLCLWDFRQFLLFLSIGRKSSDKDHDLPLSLWILPPLNLNVFTNIQNSPSHHPCFPVPFYFVLNAMVLKQIYFGIKCFLFEEFHLSFLKFQNSYIPGLHFHKISDHLPTFCRPLVPLFPLPKVCLCVLNFFINLERFPSHNPNCPSHSSNCPCHAWTPLSS